MLDGVIKGKIQMPYLLLAYGTEGAGKTTFGADMPNPIFVGPEAGSNQHDVARFSNFKNVSGELKQKTYEDILRDLDALIIKPHDYKTLVVDSIDWIEPLIYDYLMRKWKVDQIEECGGGFGKWVNVVAGEWKIFIERLNNARTLKKMNVLLICHYQVKKFDDPQSKDPYERYSLKLQEKASALLREYVDAVLFMNTETHTKKEKGMMKAKAWSDGDRYIFTEKSAAFDAKNRFGLPQKIKLDKDHPFVEFEKVLKGSAAGLELINKEITDLLASLTDVETVTKVTDLVEKNKTNYAQLCKYKERLVELTNVGGN